MRKPIVVTGMGCVCPVGNDVPSAWENVSKGRSGIDRITKFEYFVPIPCARGGQKVLEISRPTPDAMPSIARPEGTG